ncbi:MAG: hypothetical protein K2L50_03475 [Bacteroidales bacterium]|nr:hypothetical protein [Bacteroidales bacterium]
MKVSSSVLPINGDAGVAYRKISNFAELGGMMPPGQVQDWKATQDTCSFNVGGMAQISMRISQKVEPSLVVITSEGSSPFPFTLAFHFEPSANGGFNSTVEAEVGINMVMAAMIKGQMQKFVDTLNQQIKTFAEAH